MGGIIGKTFSKAVALAGLSGLLCGASLAQAVAQPSGAVPTWTAKAKQSSQPSFNCARARSMAERRICAVPAFGAQDRAIAAIYSRLVAKTPRADRAALAADQASFNRSREDCYTAEQAQDDCLGGLLSSRVWQLNNWMREGYR
jgi:uncharacterized protein